MKNITGLQIIKDDEDYDLAEVTDLQAWAKRARIYDNQHVTWGKTTFEFSNSETKESTTRAYWFIADDFIQNFRNVDVWDQDFDEFSDEEAYKDLTQSSKKMRLAFFVDGDRLSRKVSELNNMLVKDVFYQVLMVMLLAATLFIIIGILRVKRLAAKMTAQIIYLYETLY